VDRRTFNKAALLTPFLPSMNLFASDAKQDKKTSSLFKLKKNVVLISVNLGFLPHNFTPDNDNSLNSRYLTKFSPVHKKMTIFNDIEQPERLGGHRNHHSIFTAQSKFGKIQTPFVSMDQLMAVKTIQETRKKFVSIATGSREGMSFNMNGLPVPPISSPDALYNYLFSKTSSIEKLESQKNTLQVFKNKLVPSKSDKYYRDVLEESIDVAENNIKWAKIEPAKINYKVNSTKNATMDLPIYLDLIKLGLQKKQSNINVLDIKNNGTVPLEGVTLGYHANSHHNNETDKLTQLGLIEDFVTDKLADFVNDLEKLNLLDDTIVLIAGNMGDPSLHSMKDMCVILAGGGFKHEGRRIPCKDKGVLVHPLANLYTTVLHQSGFTDLNGFAGILGDMDKLLL